MLRKIFNSKSLLALALPLVAFGFSYAGGPDCQHKDGKAAAMHADSGKGVHCHLSMSKNIVKSAKMTKDGAVVTMEGKTDEAVELIHEHLAKHEKGDSCPNCPMSMTGVHASFKETSKGGEVTLAGSDAETIKAVQEWAKKPAACCADAEKDQV